MVTTDIKDSQGGLFALGESLSSAGLVLALLARQLGGSLLLVGLLPSLQSGGFLLPQLLASRSQSTKVHKMTILLDDVACIPGLDFSGNCPEPAGPDYDFGQGPALFTVNTASGKRDLLGAGQKSGQYWTFNPDTGAVVWTTQVGPGGVTGGLQWGSATDGKRIYVADANSSATPWELVQNGQTVGPAVTSGFWSALDAATGKILWQTPDPAGGQTQDPGAVTAANGVVFACSADPLGYMYALNAATGSILWSFASGGACNAGAAVSNGTVYWGSGYRQFFTGNNKVFAFRIPGT